MKRFGKIVEPYFFAETVSGTDGNGGEDAQPIMAENRDEEEPIMAENR